MAVQAAETGRARELSLRTRWGGARASRPRGAAPGAPGVRSACVGPGRAVLPGVSNLRQWLVLCLGGKPGPSRDGACGPSQLDVAGPSSPPGKGESGLSLSVRFGTGTAFWGLQKQPPGVGKCRLQLLLFPERELARLGNEYEEKQGQAGAVPVLSEPSRHRAWLGCSGVMSTDWESR